MEFREIESKWQERWERDRIFHADISNKPKFFITIPYPYLNGNLHAGHTRTFTIGDALARYKRMLGYNVLFPMGFHVTGTPIIGLAELIEKRDERTIEVYTRYHDVPKDILLNLTTPEKIVEYFSREAENAMRRIGYSIDWRRKFTTTDEAYQKFIEWQYYKLRDMGLIVKGSHPVRYCPNDENPVEDHDLLMGEDTTIVEFTVIKFKVNDSSLILPCATLRPETIFGVTNIWLKPVMYAIVEVDGERWIVSKEAYEKLKYFEKSIKLIDEINAKELFGKLAENPINGEKVPILPAEFVDTDNATGVVMSVPAHAPFDYIALKDLEKDEETLKKYGLNKRMIESIIERIPSKVLIKIEGEHYKIPAGDVVHELGIENQMDENLEKATKIVYKKEFHNGIMLDIAGEYSGMRVALAKDKIHADLLSKGIGDVFYEFSDKPVVCRCGTKCVVKVVRDQWFLNYSNQKWKEEVLNLIDEMKIIPDYYKQEFKNKVEWLKDKACARRKGLGTKIPWDKEWLIESLSDSTIYMAYYIISKFVNEGKLKVENLIPEFFDYVFLGKGDVRDLASKCNLDVDMIKMIREEFLYWYPVDLRSSGKDLVANHLLFFLFHHVAIFPKELWPRAIAVNGYVSLEGKKMSKSKGPLLTMKKAVEEFGADVTRLYILHASEYDNDADWRRRDVEGLASNLKRFYELVREYYLRDVDEITDLDRWLISRMQRAIRNTREAMEKLQTRKAVNSAFFEMLNDVRWYLKRGGRNLSLIIDDWLKLLAPFAPHLCEELWHLKHDSYIALERYPEYDENKVDKKAEMIENYIKMLLEDMNEILKFVPNAKRLYIAVAEDWKKDVARIAKSKGNLNEAMKVIMSDERFSDMKREVSAFVKRLFRESVDFYEIDEEDVIKGAIEFFKKETGVIVEINPEKVPESKRRTSMPGKPALFAE